jgi:transmembrane sensor
MRDVVAEIDRAAADVHVPWDEERATRALAGFQRARRRGQQLRRAGVLASLALLVGGAVLATRPGTRPMASRAPAARAQARPAIQPLDDVQRLHDGSLAVAIGPASRVRVDEDGGTRIRARVEQGRGRFEVTKNPARQFRVEAGRVAVTALGTVFTVALEGEGALVAVQEGRVRVEWPQGSAELAAGAQARFPPEAPPAAEPPAAARRSERAPVRANWMALARERRYAESYALLERTPPPAVWSADDLMMAADAARLSGHVRDAIPYLERILREHRGDARSPQAAFIMGKMLLSMLAQPAAAAARFAEARALAPTSPLAEDALAREVEAWARAGDAARARARASEYLRAYPNGARRDAVAPHAKLP